MFVHKLTNTHGWQLPINKYNWGEGMPFFPPHDNGHIYSIRISTTEGFGMCTFSIWNFLFVILMMLILKMGNKNMWVRV